MNKETYQNKIKLLYEVTNELVTLLSKTDFEGSCLVFAKSIIIRLQATYKATKCLLENTLKIESLLLIRFIQEQIAFSYSVSNRTDINDLNKISITKSINKYKERFPKFGELYGELSMFAHLGKEKAFSFIKIYRAGAGAKVSILHNFNSDNEYHEMFLYYYFAVFLYVDISEYLMSKAINDDNIENRNNEIVKIREKLNKLKIMDKA